jgi:ABC-type bacteriocin/lantibiotic exporter with double-glycine peptidase domain
LLLIGILVPYLKPLVRPPRWSTFRDRWSDGVCLQSTSASCGPASAATLLKMFGRSATEEELARECYTYAAGTENWFLARAMRRREMDVRFVQIDGLPEKIPWPSIAGVRLRGPSGPGHFIAILGVEGESVVVGDPLVGRLTIRREEWLRRYHGAGFFMTVVKRQSKQVCSSS